MKTLRLVLLALLGACPKPYDGVDPKLVADGHYLQGQAAYLKGDFEEAAKQFAEARKLNPDDRRLPVAEGELALSQVKIDDALAAFERAVKLDANRAASWSRLGYLYALKNNRAKAQEALDRAISLNPRDYNAHESVAELQLEAGDRDGGLATLRHAFELAPDIAKAELALRLTGELQKSGRGDEVRALLEEAVKQGARSPTVYSELGDQLVAAGRLADAVNAYTEAAKLDRKDPAHWELVGHLQARLKAPKEAEAAFRESLKVQDRGVVHVALARLCQEKKDETCVKAELDAALDTASGEELRETLDLAELLISLGRKPDALALYLSLGEEPDSAANVELHLRTARLAVELKNEAAQKTACERALAAQPGVKCP